MAEYPVKSNLLCMNGQMEHTLCVKVNTFTYIFLKKNKKNVAIIWNMLTFFKSNEVTPRKGQNIIIWQLIFV